MQSNILIVEVCIQQKICSNVGITDSYITYSSLNAAREEYADYRRRWSYHRAKAGIQP